MTTRRNFERVRQADVAQMAGVAISTVSRVFSNPERVNIQTVAHVRQVADTLGYQMRAGSADPQDRQDNRHGLLMLMVRDTSDIISSQILKGAQLAAFESDHAVGVIETGKSVKSAERMLNMLQGNVDGVMLSTDQVDVDMIQRIGRKLPLVVLNRPVEQVHSVIPNPLLGISRMLMLFRRYGLRRITYVSGMKDSWANRSRWECLCLLSRKLGFSIRQIGPVTPNIEGGYQAAIGLENDIPDAIVTYNDVIAAGVVLRMTADGISVPGRTSVVGFDNTLLSPVVSPAITTIRIPRARLGQAAVDILLEKSNAHPLNTRDAQLLQYLADHGIPSRMQELIPDLMPDAGRSETTTTEIHTSLIVRGSVGPKTP